MLIDVDSDLNNVLLKNRFLFEKVKSKSIFITDHWLNTVAPTILEQGNQSRIYSARHESADHASCILPLAIQTKKIFPGVRSRGLISFQNYYSSLFGPIIDRTIVQNESFTALDTIMHHIANESPRWDFIEIRPLDTGTADFEFTINALKKAGFIVQKFYCFGNWYLPSAGLSYENYLASRSSRLRNTLKRKRKKLFREHTVDCKIITSHEEAEAHINAYQVVYKDSWKKPEPHPHFIPQLIRTYAELGKLRFGILYVDGQPAAAQIWLVHEGIASIFKLAYDDSFVSLSVGSILTEELMRHVLDKDHVHEIDYLTGDDAYKKDWMSYRRERWGILALNPRTPAGILGIIRHVIGHKVRSVAKTFINGNTNRPDTSSPDSGRTTQSP
jgi:hypothetical protein